MPQTIGGHHTYSVDDAFKCLRRKHDFRFYPAVTANPYAQILVEETPAHIEVLSRHSKDAANDIGQKAWGKIDFLSRYFAIRRVKEFS